MRLLSCPGRGAAPSERSCPSSTRYGGAAPQSRDLFEDGEPDARMLDPGSAAQCAATIARRKTRVNALMARIAQHPGKVGVGGYGSPAFAGTTADEAGVASIALDTPTPRFVNRTLLALYLAAGRIAQRESVPFTRERSKVRSLVRPPVKALQMQGFFIFTKCSNVRFMTFRYVFLRLDTPKNPPNCFWKKGILMPFSAFLHSSTQRIVRS